MMNLLLLILILINVLILFYLLVSSSREKFCPDDVFKIPQANSAYDCQDGKCIPLVYLPGKVIKPKI